MSREFRYWQGIHQSSLRERDMWRDRALTAESRLQGGCENCDFTGIVRWQNKRKEWFEQPCYMCELGRRIEASNQEKSQ